MILSAKETTITYRCPECGSWVSSIVGMFALSADMVRLKCTCGKSEMTIENTSDGKVRLKVPCFFCPQEHTYTISSNMFYNRDIFALPCAYSGIDISYMGRKDAIDEAVRANDEELLEILGDTGYEEFANARDSVSDDFLSDPQILDIVSFVIRDLDEAGEIRCRCPEDEGCYSIEVTDEAIIVKCDNCGASAVIPVTSTITANAFLECTHLDLK